MSEGLVTAALLGVLPGWYGKLPSLGDFASRRLPDGFIQPWDRWLQRGLACARAELGEAPWLDVYLVAPVLRFWCAPGIVDASGWAGVMMPSVDRVGRHFPLTVARPLVSLAAALAARPWYGAIDRAARRVLDTSFSVDDFEDALGAIDAGPPGPSDAASVSLAARLLDAHPPASVWWCEDAMQLADCRTFAGLPPERRFASLLGAPS
jgi:type VI secretion system protein ImpM